MSNKILAVGVSVLVFVVVFFGAWQVLKINKTLPEQPPMTYPDKPSSPVMGSPVVASDFGSKIVYDQTNGTAIEALEKDCAARGGTFNECGSICAPDAQACVMMCGRTCENLTPPKMVTCDANTPCPTGQSCYSLPGTTSPQCVTGNVCEQACGTKDCLVAESYPPQVRCQK